MLPRSVYIDHIISAEDSPPPCCMPSCGAAPPEPDAPEWSWDGAGAPAGGCASWVWAPLPRGVVSRRSAQVAPRNTSRMVGVTDLWRGIVRYDWNACQGERRREARAIVLFYSGSRGLGLSTGDAHEETAPAARPGPAPQRVRSDRGARRGRGRGAELRRRDRGGRHPAGSRRDLHARPRRPPQHRGVGGRHGRRHGGGAVRGGPEGFLRTVPRERDDGRERLQHDRRGGRRAPGERRHAVRSAGRDPGRHRAGWDPGGHAPRARGRDRAPGLAVARPGEGCRGGRGGERPTGP